MESEKSLTEKGLNKKPSVVELIDLVSCIAFNLGTQKDTFVNILGKMDSDETFCKHSYVRINKPKLLLCE